MEGLLIEIKFGLNLLIQNYTGLSLRARAQLLVWLTIVYEETFQCQSSLVEAE